MALTNDQLLDRINEIEAEIDKLATAANNLATRKELKNLFAILNQTIQDLQSSIDQINNVSASAEISIHNSSNDAHAPLDTRYFLRTAFVTTSAGPGDAGLPVKLSASGVLDSSLLPGGSVTDHGAMGGLSDDDHPQYYNAERLAADATVQSGLSAVHSRTHEIDSVADHAAAYAANWGKYLRASPSDGKIEFVTLEIPEDGLTVTPKTASYPITSSDDQTLFTNEGATAEVIFTLPTAVAGLTYTFVVQVLQNLRVTAAAGDTIRILTELSAAAGNAVSIEVGSTLTLVAINATEWIATSALGTWTVT